MENDLVPDVGEFLNKCSSIVGKSADESFNQNNWCFVFDNEVNSPIEQILYFAFETLREMNCLKAAEPYDYPGGPKIIGVELRPQVKIGKYRVDFLASFNSDPHPEDLSQNTKELIVECDSQQFHDRTERERRYEKERDRFLQQKGYTIFHYTGKEIKDKPFKVASEILAFIAGGKSEHFIDENFITE